MRFVKNIINRIRDEGDYVQLITGDLAGYVYGEFNRRRENTYRSIQF